MTRIPPNTRLSLLADELRHGSDAPGLVGELFRLGGRKLVQEQLEAEVTERLGRQPYERLGDAPQGHRNGHKPRKIRTAEGDIEVDVPQVRDTEEPFHLDLWEGLRRRMEVLDRLVLEMFA